MFAYGQKSYAPTREKPVEPKPAINLTPSQMVSKGEAEEKKKNYSKAYEWYNQAAVLGNIKGQVNLGLLYAKGLGVKKDYLMASRWYRQAAEQGDAWAQFLLGLLYYDKECLGINYSEALKWFRKAAEQGDEVSQYMLGTMYAGGMGVSKDYSEALKWYQKAADQGDKDAKEAVEKLKSILQSSQKSSGNTISGIVTDADGVPIIGCTVMVENTGNGVATDIDGKYTLNNVKPGDIIVFSYVGMAAKKIKFKGTSVENIKMK